MDFLSKRFNKSAQSGRHPANLLALDFATTGVKAVRLKKIKDQVTLAAVEILPPCDVDAGKKPVLPKSLSSYYAALCATMDNVTLRVFTQVLPEEENIEALVREHLSAAADCRVSGTVISRAKGRRDSTVLGLAVPEQTVQNYLALFSDGAPAPRSLGIPGLAAFSAFLYNRAAQTENQTICLIETGARYTYAAFLHQNQLQLMNRFEVGSDVLQRQIQASLGVDAAMAVSILAGGSVDVSVAIRQALNPFTRQLSVYCEFIERQNKNPISSVYISGGLASSPYWQSAIKDVLGCSPQGWNPFEKIEIPPDTFPEQFKGQEPRFAAAVGAVLAGMEAL